MGPSSTSRSARLQKLLADRKITLDLDDAARNWLADKGYDPAYGARPLKRVIQKNVQDPLAEEILAGRIKDGETVEIGCHRRRADLQRQGAGRQAGRSESREAALTGHGMEGRIYLRPLPFWLDGAAPFGRRWRGTPVEASEISNRRNCQLATVPLPPIS